MNYSDDAFATMLLTMALSPNREEYARPLGTLELKKLEEKVRESELFHIGNINKLLMNIVIRELVETVTD